MPEHKKPLTKKIRGFVQSETLFPYGASTSVATHGLAQKFTYQPTLAYSRRLPLKHARSVLLSGAGLVRIKAPCITSPRFSFASGPTQSRCPVVHAATLHSSATPNS